MPASKSPAMTVKAKTRPVMLLDLKAQYAAIREELRAAIDRVSESQHFILGPEVEGLEREVADYSQCEFGIGVSSGSDALLVALMALDLKPGDEVVTTPYTFFATAGAVSRLGAKPVFVDIDPLTYNLEPAAIEAAITERTRAIMPVHLYGQMARMRPIMEIAERHHLYVIEDAAQAIGSEDEGRRAGSTGHFGCFSFYPSKNLGGFGDGGMVTTNDPQLAERIKMLRNHGYSSKYYNKLVGGNFRLDAIQAAVLRVKLKYLDEWTQARQRNAARYRDLFTEAGLSINIDSLPYLRADAEEAAIEGSAASPLASLDGVVLPVEAPGVRHIYNQFVIRSGRRDELISFLTKHQIGTEIYYPVPMHMQECFADLGYREGEFPQSERAAAETLALPIYPELTEEMLSNVVLTIAKFYEGSTEEE